MDGGSHVLTSSLGSELETLRSQNPEMRLGDYLIPRHRQYLIKVAFIPPIEKYVLACGGGGRMHWALLILLSSVRAAVAGVSESQSSRDHKLCDRGRMRGACAIKQSRDYRRKQKGMDAEAMQTGRMKIS